MKQICAGQLLAFEEVGGKPGHPSGRVDISYYSYNLVLPFAEAGKMRILAIMDSKRYVNAPDIPAIAETLPNFQRMPSWISVSGPAGLPRPIVNRLNASVIKAINAPELRAEFTKGGAQAVGGTPEEFVAAMKADIEVTARVVKAAKIEPE